MLEKTLENPLDCKEIKSVNPKGNQSWTFIGMTDAEAEAPILWPPDGKNWLIGKDPDVGKDGRQEEKGMTEDRIVGWHHWLDEHEFEQALGVGDGQGSPACCSPWGRKESDTTEWLNWTERPWNYRWFCHFILLDNGKDIMYTHEAMSQVVLGGKNLPANAETQWVGNIPWRRKWKPTPVFLNSREF